MLHLSGSDQRHCNIFYRRYGTVGTTSKEEIAENITINDGLYSAFSLYYYYLERRYTEAGLPDRKV